MPLPPDPETSGAPAILCTVDSYSWHLRPFDWDTAERFASELELPLLVGIVLARRGFRTVEEVRAFMEISPTVPDPFLFHDMPAALGLLAAAARKSRRVVVHGDYDVDGISATALLVRGLADFGVRAEGFLPSRFVQGYGLSEAGIREIAADGDALLVTVDCGVNYPDEVTLARSLGLDVIVTDHHQAGPTLPDCPLIHVARADYPHADLCGVGVALKLLHALHVRERAAASETLPEALLAHLDLVALGTIADLVPLKGENRYYVHEGLVRLAASSKPGLRALLKVANGEARVDAQAVGFRMAPRLNAAGRLGDAQMPLRLLLTDDAEEAGRLAQELDLLNRERQEIEASVLAEATAAVDALDDLAPILVVSGAGWHEGVLGIVASRLVERHHRPAVVLSEKEGLARGSARSIPAYDIMAGLEAAAEHLTVFGGHRQAAGMTLPSAALPAFKAALEAHAGTVLTPADLVPTYHPEAIVRGCDLTLETTDAFARLAPFGSGNPKVRLIALDARFEAAQSTRKGDHLQCTVVVDDVRTRGIGFGLAPKLPALVETGLRGHAGIRLEASEWQGTSRAEVHLHSLYRADDVGAEHLGCVPECPFRDPLDAPTSCPGCLHPLGEVTHTVPLAGRDLRDGAARLSSIGEVLSSGESVAVVGSAVRPLLQELAGSLPLRELGVTGVECVSRHCWRTHSVGSGTDSLLIADWDAAERRAPLFRDRRHLVVADPPYLASHTALVADLARAGVRVHLAYGDPERERTVAELRVRLHPRYWMVALYRAGWGSSPAEEVFAKAEAAAWEADEVLPTSDGLRDAAALLDATGHGSGDGGQATMKATDLPAYREAEHAYREAVRLCRRM